MKQINDEIINQSIVQSEMQRTLIDLQKLPKKITKI